MKLRLEICCTSQRRLFVIYCRECECGRNSFARGESLETALPRFKRKVQTEDLFKEVKRHSYYLKSGRKTPSETGFGEEARPKKFGKKVH